MKVAAFSAITMLAGLSVGSLAIDTEATMLLGLFLVPGAFFCGLLISVFADD